jgi:negative regulator of sigma E activity
MSLAELIEFFCNQRKTGRLKIDYPRGHSVFFIRDGELVDAKVGALSGVEAVYFSLTLPNAAFDFSPDVQSKSRTINEPWTQVVLEGLRRLDEGLSPKESDAFGGWTPSETELAQMLDQVEQLDAQKHSDASKSQRASDGKEARKDSPAARAESAEPFSTMVESASGGSKKKWVVMGVAAAVVLAVAVAAVPFLNHSAKDDSAPAAVAPSQPATPAQAAPSNDTSADTAATDSSTPAPDASATADAAADAARRAREEREREKRKREQDAQKANDQPADATAAAATKPATPAPSGPKSVRVAVTYDEAGRVTQASVAGATPGAEAYGSTAVRVARGKHFPAGKAGTTVVTIPIPN